MNNTLSNMLETVCTPFNAEVVNGIATNSIKTAPDYIDAIIKSSMRSATPKLEYHGWRRLSPHEEYESLFTTGNNRINYDIARSDLYKIELLFSYNGVKLPKRYLYLPTLEDGGIINISDTQYHIVPVLSDTVVSPNEKEVFVRLLRDKLTFKRVNRNIIKNGRTIAGDVIHATVYRTSNRGIKDSLGNIVTPIALYLFAEYGLMDAFKKYTGVMPIITYDKNVDVYKNTHDIYESTKLKPRTLKANIYVGHNVKVLIPKGTDSPLVQNMITGLMYVFDVSHLKANEMVDVVNIQDVEKETVYWKLLLGRITFKDSYSADRTLADITDHFVSLRSYIDSLIKDKLSEIDININNFFDLISVILSRYSDWLLNSKTYSNNIFNRYVDVLYYILYDIILGVNKSIFELTRKSIKKDLNEREASRIFNSSLSSKTFYKVLKASAQNLTIYLLD